MGSNAAKSSTTAASLSQRMERSALPRRGRRAERPMLNRFGAKFIRPLNTRAVPQQSFPGEDGLPQKLHRVLIDECPSKCPRSIPARSVYDD
jgi:hypothetical protein